MPRILQRLNTLPKLGNPLTLVQKGLGPLARPGKKEGQGLAARQSSSPSAQHPLKTQNSSLLARQNLAPLSLKKLSNFVSRPLKQLQPNTLSKEEKKSHAFLKAGYDPKGHLSEVLERSFVKQDHLKGRLKAFGAGQLNTVYKGHFKNSEGKLEERIIKFETSYTREKDRPDFFKAVGIHGTCSQETARNLAAKALDDILGWNSIVPTDIALLKHPQTQVYTVATAMQRAPGVSGYGKPLGFQPVSEEDFIKYKNCKNELAGDPFIQDSLNGIVIQLGAYDPQNAREILDKNGDLIGLEIQKRSHAIDPHDPALKTAFLKLQLQDIIMNQGDRHLGNYFIQTSTEKNAEGKEDVLGIVGIDNDLLGGKSSEINTHQQSSTTNSKKVPCPPPQIPSSLCYEILNIPMDKFQETMQLYLGKEEAEAATARLGQVKEHVLTVFKNNLKKGENSFLYPHHSSNSYWMNFLAVHFPQEATAVAAKDVAEKAKEEAEAKEKAKDVAVHFPQEANAERALP